MKKRIAYIAILCFITFFACKKDETKVTTSENPSISVLSNPGNLILAKVDSAHILTFKWAPANFGFNAVVNYSLEIDHAANNFSKPITIGSTIHDTAFAINANYSCSISLYLLKTQ